MPRSLVLLAAMLFGGSMLAGARSEPDPALARSAANPRPVTEWLDLYLAGQFDAVMSAVEQEGDFGRVLDELKKSGPAWLAAGAPEARDRRELAAATFALEAARLDEWNEWKTRMKVPAYLGYYDEKGVFHIPEVLTWQTPPLLIEWGCALMRRASGPRPIERWWQLAALAVAQRAEDAEFLRSDTVTNIYNVDAEVDHLLHVRRRFPDEPRFQLAEAMLTEMNRRPPVKGLYTFDQLQRDPDVGGEATMRLGVARARGRDDDGAIELFNRVETQTRDAWVIYLARYFKGQAFERKRRPAEAERAYRGALATVPAATSASIDLAALLFRGDRRTEATGLIETMFAAKPMPADPWRGYADADDRFWPELITALRGAIRR